MTNDVVGELNAQTPSPFHQALLQHALALTKMSRAKMAENYTAWDLQDQVYRGERWADEDDVKQAKKEKPIKMVVPNTFAQVMTFASFLFLMFNQRSPLPFFALLPSGDEDYGDKEKDCEKVVQKDLNHNKFNSVLFQHLLDVGRFGPSILETSWTRKISHIYVASQPTVVNYQGIQHEIAGGSEWRDFLKFEGSQIRNVSPYRFFPDTRFPLTDFQRGEFCGSEEEYSISMLNELESVGEVAGIRYIQPLPNNLKEMRGADTRTTMGITQDASRTMGSIGNWLAGPSQSKGTALVTKLQVRLVPSQFRFGPRNAPMGPETFPVLYHLWYANDNRVIRCEPAYWWHDEFGYTVSQFTPDMHRTVNLGLADLIYRIQDVVSWHINARITDVRRNMRGRLVMEPSAIDMDSVNGEGDIYLRKGMGKGGIDRVLKQLDVHDTTSGHMADADILSKIMEVVTGVNGNAMGQYNSGRRSAQEARVVTAGAAGRMKMHGHLIWDSGLGPLGRMLLSNSRQSLSEEMFMRAIGRPVDPQRLAEMQLRYKLFQGTPDEVCSGDDFFTFDSTLASEKGFMASSIQELLIAILQADPMAAQRMTSELDPTKIMGEVQYLRGAGNISRFRYTPQQQQEITAEQQRRWEIEHQPPPPKPPNLSLSGKMSQGQEDNAAELAGIGAGRGEKPQANPAPKPSTNGSK